MNVPSGTRIGEAADHLGHRYSTADGPRWQVRWRDNGKVRTRSLTSRREAVAFDADVKAKKFKGEALPRATRQYGVVARLLGLTVGV